MKRIVSFFLIVLLLMNVMGYYGIFLGLKYKHAIRFNHSLDNESYHSAQTVTIKVPLALPYVSETGYERVEGEIEYNGEFYRLVKQKLSNDTLHIVCIRDVKSERIKQALAEYVKTFRDSPAGGQQKAVPAFIKDYVQSCFSLVTASDGWDSSVSYPPITVSLQDVVESSPSPPPKG